ncbi:MAG: DUF1311 domain-containing protein [Rhodobacteraceae bacterium]|nr:DUF1311 domain-containing protein [Paracoccaceae bacterium]
MTKLLSPRALIVVALVSGATAAWADPSLECSLSVGSQVEIGDCVSEAAKTVDATVELALGIAMDAAKELDSITEREVSVPALEAAQTAWLAYREQQCAFVGTTFGGGSGTGIAMESCQVELGRARVEELMDYIQ